MKFVIIGSGAQGAGGASILGHDEETESVIVGDINFERAQKVVAKIGSDKLIPTKIDAGNLEEIVKISKGYDAILNYTQPRFNINIMNACIEVGAHYVDTAAGPNLQLEPVDMMLDRQMALDKKFKDLGLLAVMACGGTPGLTDVLGKYCADKLDTVEEIGVYSGGRPKAAKKEMELKPLYLGWSNEVALLYHATPGIIFEDGKMKRMPPLSGYEEYPFPPPCGPAPCTYVDHEEPYLLGKFIGKGIKRAIFKQGPNETVSTLVATGFADPNPIDVKGVKVVPRDVLLALIKEPVERFLEEKMPTKIAERDSYRGSVVTAKGTKNGENVTITLDRSVPRDLKEVQAQYKKLGTNIVGVAMPAIVAMKLKIKKETNLTGVVGPECYDAMKFLKTMAKEGVQVKFNEIIKTERAIIIVLIEGETILFFFSSIFI